MKSLSRVVVNGPAAAVANLPRLNQNGAPSRSKATISRPVKERWSPSPNAAPGRIPVVRRADTGATRPGC